MRIPASTSRLEELLAIELSASRVPAFRREYRFHPQRRWRFDFAWPERRLAVEVEGGSYVQGRHQRAAGFERDAEKYNAAALLGWRVLRFTGAMVRDGRAARQIVEALRQECISA